MRVGVNLTWLVPGVVGGSEESTTRALAAIPDVAPDLEVTLFALPSLAAAHPSLAGYFDIHEAPVSGRQKLLRVGAEYTWLAAGLRHVDVVHHAGGTSPGWTRAAKVLTIHDIQPLDLPEHFSRVKVAYLGVAVPRALRGASRIVVPSGFVRDRLVDRFAIDPTAIAVVPHPVPDATNRTPVAELRRRYGLPERFLVLPAITYPHKRHRIAVEVLRGIPDDVGLVLTGGAGPSEAELGATIARLGVADRVFRLGRVPAADVHGLIGAARALVFPSIYEGFGLPALEAMALGCPVVVADAGALPEVVGAAGRIVAPDDVEAWTAAVAGLLAADNTEMVAAGRARAATFTAAASATGLVAAYRSVGGGR